jgi:LysM repeat protein
VVAVGALLGLGLLAAACNSGGGTETGSRETDPALVPTSTPMQNPLTFRVRNDEIEIIRDGAGTTGGTTGSPQTHTVAEGETCADIANAYGITVDALIRANRSINADCTNLGTGDELRIPSATPTAGPSGSSTPAPGGGGNTYTVAEGDTCADIAAQFGVSADEIIALNGLDADCATLQPGDVLQIP